MTTVRPLKVLVVDDDFRVAALHADVVAASSATPDLVLADVYLPDGDGIDLVRSIGLDAFVPTAATEPATVRRALAAGVHAYLVKPFTRQTLTVRLERFARFRAMLDTLHPVNQEEIDRALALLHGADLPVGTVATATESLILEALGDAECSAAEVAGLSGVSRATAQRRLTALRAGVWSGYGSGTDIPNAPSTSTPAPGRTDGDSVRGRPGGAPVLPRGEFRGLTAVNRVRSHRRLRICGTVEGIQPSLPSLRHSQPRHPRSSQCHSTSADPSVGQPSPVPPP